MPVKLEWRFEKAKATDKVLSQLESHYKVILPMAYKQLVKQHNGARPRPNLVKDRNGVERVVKTFLTVHPTKGGMRDVSEWLADQLPERLIPFASDPFGNYFCFQYQKQEAEPTIVFWNHEKKQAENFTSSFEAFFG